jgi:hypothetical protein
MFSIAASPETLAEFLGQRSNDRAGSRIVRSEKQGFAKLQLAQGLSRSEVEAEIGHAYRKTLNVKMADVFLGAWAKLSEIAKYADTAKYPRGESHLVPLLRHRIVSRHEPKIQLLLNGAPVIDLAIAIALEAQFDGAVLRIDGGKVRSIMSGSYAGRATVECQGVMIGGVASKRYHFQGEKIIHPGYPIPGYNAAPPPRKGRM